MFKYRKYLINIYFISIILISALMPFNRSLLISGTIIIAVVLAAILNVIYKRYAYNSFFIICLVYFLILVLGLFYSDDLAFGLFNIEKNLSFIALPVALSAIHIFHYKKLLKAVLITFLMSSITSSLVCVIYAAFNYSENSSIFRYSYFTNVINAHPAYLSIYLSFSFFILIYLCNYTLINRHYLYRILILIVLIFLSVMIIFLKSRMPLGIFVSLISLTSVYIFLKNKKYRPFIGVGVLILGLIFFAIIRIDVFTRYRLLSSVNYGLEMRLNSWDAAINAIYKNTIMGVGTGDLKKALHEEYLVTNFREGLEYNYNSHNQYLDNWVQNGLPGLLILLILIFYPMYHFFREGKYLSLLFILSISLFCITESALSRQQGVVFFIYFAYIFMYNDNKVKIKYIF